MVSQCVENNRTDPLTCSCRWMHEGANLWSYVGGCVRRGTEHQKHKETWFVLPSQTWGQKITRTYHIVLGWHPTTKPFHAFLMTRMKFGAHTSKTRESTVNITVSGSSLCMWNCIFSHSETHTGLARDRNTNLGALASETMWCPHILIQLLAVLINLQPHIHISTCSSLHCERISRSQFVLKFEKTVFIWLRLPLKLVHENQFAWTHFLLVKSQPIDS